MPQLSLYVDKKMMKQLETGASAANLSISKYVSTTLKEHFNSDWPIGYFETFRNGGDETWIVPEELNFADDATREEFI